MDKLEAVLSAMDHILNTKRKRHIAGGVLMSLSMLFGGLAVTVLTLKQDLEREQEKEEENDYDVYLD